ncbi:hypothetical protein NKH54_19405 [Mesorhizobium sp. M1004]
MNRKALWLGVALALLAGPVLAEKSSEFFKDYQQYSDDGKAFLDKIDPKTGAVDLPEGIHLDLKDKFYFLGKKDATSVLT